MLLFDLTYIFQFNSSATPGSGNYFGYNGFMFNVEAIKDITLTGITIYPRTFNQGGDFLVLVSGGDFDQVGQSDGGWYVYHESSYDEIDSESNTTCCTGTCYDETLFSRHLECVRRQEKIHIGL